MQIKAGIKKELLQFMRTFRFGGMLLGITSFAIADPLMYYAMNVLLGSVDYTTLSISSDYDIDAIYSLFGSASTIFAQTMAELCSTSMLIVMLLLMSPCGGEQKKRATIIPSCTGLGTFQYLVPKYIVYPSAVFAIGFLSSLIAGGLCNGIFEYDKLDFGYIAFASLLCAVYLTFFVTVYMSIGLCTSRPGVTTVFMYVGVSLVQIFLQSLGLTQYHPLTLRSLVTGEMFSEDFVLADNVGSIAVGIVLSVVIGVMMFVLTFCVQKGTKINNQVDKPEF